MKRRLVIILFFTLIVSAVVNSGEVFAQVCGDGICGWEENCYNCPEDCGSCASYCGDGICNGVETCSSCKNDCGDCFYEKPAFPGWTEWFDIDDPGGKGDYEVLDNEIIDAGTCENPTDVECQTISGIDASETGEVIRCDTVYGFECVNSRQPDEWCDYDYRVRFYCEEENPTCGNGNCDAGEDCSSCPSDCGSCASYCGDNVCEYSDGEDNINCPEDCSIYTSQEGWPQPSDSNIRSPPKVADIDNDGGLEVIVGSLGGKVYAWHYDGTILNGWPQTTNDKVLASPAIADIDSDGDMEIIIGSFDAKMYVWNHDGTLVDGWPYDTSYVQISPAQLGAKYGGCGDTGGCSDGHCVSIEPYEINGCSETDGNSNYFLKGTASDGSISLTDYCDGDTLVEAYCRFDKYNVDEDRYFCSYGCSDGACNIDETAVSVKGCGETDGGKNQYLKGTTYIDGKSYQDGCYNDNEGYKEYYCEFSYTNITVHPEIYSSAVIGDVDGDGDLEIVVGTKNDRVAVWIWHHDGTVMEGWPKSVEAPKPVLGGIIGTPSIVDLDNDGDLEIIVGGANYYLYIWNHDGTDFDYNKDGVAEWPQQICLKDMCGAEFRRIGTTAVGDINNDGEVEIVGFAYYCREDASDGRSSSLVHVFKPDGSELPGFPLELPHMTWFNMPPVLADITNDGDLEIIAGAETALDSDYGSDMIIIKYDGSYIFPKGFKELVDEESRKYNTETAATVLDLDNDGDMEILVAGSYESIYPVWIVYGRIFGWHHDGSEIIGFPIDPGRISGSTFSVNDLDFDGDLEISFGTNLVSAKLKVYDFYSVYNRDSIEYPMAFYDLRNTGVYKKPGERHYCGDRICDTNEDCNTCAADCGSCGGDGNNEPKDCSSCSESCLLDDQLSSNLISLEIKDISATPETGSVGDMFTISATVTDALAIIDVEAVFTISDGTGTTLKLYDDGLHGDSLSGDSKYGNVLNSSNIPSALYSVSIRAENSIGQIKEAIDAASINIGYFTIKDESKYTNKTAFLISDMSWEDILSLVPIAVWTENSSIKKHPLLIYHEERASDGTIYLDKNEFLEKTSFSLSWTFNDDILAEGETEGDEFSIIFDLTEDQYNVMTGGGIPRGDVKVMTSKIDPNGNNSIKYDIYFNGVPQDTDIYNKGDYYVVEGAFWGTGIAYLIKQNGNNITFKRTGGNNRIESYSLYVPYFTADGVNSYCVGDDYYDLCFEDVQVDRIEASLGDVITYTARIKNVGNRYVDLSGEYYKVGGPWSNPSSSFFSGIPYDLMFSKVNATLPKVNLAPGETADATVTVVYDKQVQYANHSFDADSVIHFLQQYNPDKLAIIGNTHPQLDGLLVAQPGLGAGISGENINRINPADYFSYWKSYKDAVYVEHDYELALLASTYASLINAPLIIQGTSLDSPNVFSGKNVICVGNVDSSGNLCNIQHNLQSLRSEYINKTSTDKIILVNPSDSEAKVIKKFTPDKSPEYIMDIYSKNSFAAAILASAKHELILSTMSTDYQEIDTFLENEISQLGLVPEYLTIVASPNSIPIRRITTSTDGCGYASRVEVDGRHYGELNHDNLVDLSTGRIYGITVSDASATVARSIFIKDIASENFDALVALSGYESDTGTSYWAQQSTESAMTSFAGYFWTDAVREKIDDEHFYAGWSNVAANRATIQNLYDEDNLVIYYNHGSTTSFHQIISTSNLDSGNMYLDNPIMIDVACSTCQWSTSTTSLFCTQNMRRGALGFHGAVDVSYWNKEFDDILNGFLLQGKAIGTAYKEARNDDYADNVYNYCSGLRGDVFYAWLGDPTIRFDEVQK